jgi:hypothetical protein
MTAASVTAGLRAAADSLAIDTVVWVARDPAEPLEFQREAMAARENALKTIDETVEQLRRLRRELAGGAHRARGRHS